MKNKFAILSIIIIAGIFTVPMFSFETAKLNVSDKNQSVSTNPDQSVSADLQSREIEIIHCTGALRRPKALDCDNNGVLEKCDCGFGVCNFHCSVFGLPIFRAANGLPVDNNKLNEDQWVVFQSVDGKYLLYKFIHFKDAGPGNEPFILDDPITYTFSGKDVTAKPQTAATYHTGQIAQGKQYLNQISNDNALYFGCDIKEINLDNGLGFAIVVL